MDCIGPMTDIIGLIGPSICRCLKYHIKLSEYKAKLERGRAELQSRMEDIRSRKDHECRHGKIPKKEVQYWLKTVEKIIAEAKIVEDEARKVKCFSRSCAGRLVDKKTQEIKEEYEKSMRSNFESLVVDDPSSGRDELPAPELVGERAVKEKIWRYLMEDEAGKIGVCGMGGIGKTTIMKHIHNDLLKETRFARVIWVTVSQAFNVGKLQDDIASRLKEKLDEGDTIMRAGKLSKMLEKQGRYVLILDDVWKRFALEEVGIPAPAPHNGCKLVLTTRSREVARSMGFQIVQVEPLSTEEALKLFSSKVGDTIMHAPTLEPIVKLVVEECAGLPLAISVVASSMRGIDELSLWKNALNELREQIIRALERVEDEVFGRLEFSYNHLKYEKDRQCFLHCALYPEDHEIGGDEITEYWIEEGLIDEMDSREAMKESGHAILQRLEENCLVEIGQSENDNDFTVKMHDVVRDMALHMTRKRFLVKAGMQLEELPEWNEDVEKVSLMQNSISKVPPNMQSSPKCQNLTTLLLSENSLKEIPESFFDNMPNLRILDLSLNPVKNLPSSLSNLKNLTALLLFGCKKLKALPSLSKLQALKKLDLRFSGIKEVPRGIKMLKKLRYLNLGFCFSLKEFPYGTISKLYRLQHLETHPVPLRVEEIRELNKLEVFAGRFIYARTDLNQYVFFQKRLRKYLICISEERHTDDDLYLAILSSDLEYSKVVAFIEINSIKTEDVIRLPSDVQLILFLDCEGGRSLNDFWGSEEALDNLKGCSVGKCKGLEFIFSSSCAVPQTLEILRLQELENLKAIVEESVPPRTRGLGTFSSLKEIYTWNCGKLKKLFWVPRNLHNLEVIEVALCEEMEEIISIEEEGMGTKSNSSIKFTLPKLRRLELASLPKLESICSTNGVMVCDALEEIEIRDCPKLKRIPLYLPLLENGNPSPPPSLKQINVMDQEWWKSLEWDHPNAKDVLGGFVRFSFPIKTRRDADLLRMRCTIL